MIEPNYIIYSQETMYRVRPNPDGESSDATEGVVLEWKEPEDTEWKGYFFIAPEVALEVAECIQRLCSGKK
jgi:hypothetical protein